MSTQITVRSLQKTIRLSSSQIVQTTKKILKAQRIADAELSLVFVTDRRIRTLNKKYLQHDWATDVLAFDLTMPTTPRLFGEVIISTDRALANAKKYQVSLKSEITMYLIHGILHLSGYRDHAPKEVARMRRKEQQLLNQLL